MTIPTVRLTKPLDRAVRGGHPWVFRDAVRLPKGLGSGDIVDLVDEKGTFVARGTIDPASPLVFRAWSLDRRQMLDERFLRARLTAARALRQDVVPDDVTAYRVCHGENDGVPGLHCDWYDGVASLRCDGTLGAAWEDRFVGAVRAVWSPRAIVVRNRVIDGGAARVVEGRVDEEVVIQEYDRRFYVDVVKGQKTGFFLDQRENRSRVAELSGGKEVLNVFAYTGGFSVAAALGGASCVTTVDIAAPAVETAARTFALNGLDPAQHHFQAADAFDVLAELSSRPSAGQGGAPDLIVLDPPSFVRNRASRERGLRAYWKLNEMALRALPSGGWLCTASCSSHISDTDFLEIVRHAVAETGRTAHIAGLFGAGPDHPTKPGFGEGRYLQFVMLRVV